MESPSQFMKRDLLIPTLALFILSTVCGAQGTGNEQLKELERKIAELEKEKTRLNAPITPPAISSTAGVFDEQEKVNPRISNAVLIIEGDISVGTGFIGATNGKKYVYTAAHVFSGNSKLSIRDTNGTSFKKFGDLETAEGADLVRMEILDEVKEALEFRPPEPPLLINTQIAALGNGGGTGVVSVEKGSIKGTGADTLEVDAGIIQGNSGGPVVEIETGKVVGLATHLSSARKDMWSEGTRQANVRRFACRLNKEWTWKRMNIGTFLADGKALDEYVILSKICSELVMAIGMSSSLHMMPAEHLALLQKTITQNPNHELVKSYRELMQERASRKTASVAEERKRNRSLLALAKSRAVKSQDSLKTQSYSWFHRASAEDAIKYRGNSITSLDQAIDRMK